MIVVTPWPGYYDERSRLSGALFCYHQPMAPVPVILDVDPGHDDAVALMLACGAPELEVRAVTTVAGNVPLSKTTRNALRVLSLIGREDVPVGAGADAPRGTSRRW